VELFYSAIGLAIEKRTGHVAAPVLKINHEGWGRVMLVAGRLVVVNAFLRDLHRFGFDSVEALAEKAEKIVEEGVGIIARYPEVAAA
jgi:probable nitrogen fixation protein